MADRKPYAPPRIREIETHAEGAKGFGSALCDESRAEMNLPPRASGVVISADPGRASCPACKLLLGDLATSPPPPLGHTASDFGGEW